MDQDDPNPSDCFKRERSGQARRGSDSGLGRGQSLDSRLHLWPWRVPDGGEPVRCDFPVAGGKVNLVRLQIEIFELVAGTRAIAYFLNRQRLERVIRHASFHRVRRSLF